MKYKRKDLSRIRKGKNTECNSSKIWEKKKRKNKKNKKLNWMIGY
jgi:hypothetical protein